VIVLGYLLAAVVGLSLGLLGGGGSILTVPIFVYVLGFDPKLAIVMSLPVVGVTSLAGALGHWRAGRVHARSAATFGAAAVIAAYLGARVAVHLTGALQLVLLGIVMLVAALSMLRSSLGDDVPREADTRGWRRALVPLAGAGVGMLTGVLGIGGGFLVVPALVLLVGQPMTQAVGTSLLVIAVNCVSGFAGYAGQVSVPWAFVGSFTLVAVAGAIAGTLLVDRVSQRALKRAFAILILVTGIFLLANNWMKLRRNAAYGRAAVAPVVPACCTSGRCSGGGFTPVIALIGRRDTSRSRLFSTAVA
jgi:uncharacterized membrane protein YfcA